MKKDLAKIAGLGALLFPFAALAQTGTRIQDILQTINAIIQLILPILAAVAIIVFIVGIIRYITAGGNEEKRKSAIHLITYGVVGLFVLVAIWGIVAVLGNTLGIQPQDAPAGPDVPIPTFDHL